jgi:hypothetical protein
VWVWVASLIVQTHVAYAYVVGALVLVVLIALLLRWRAAGAGAGATWRDLARQAATSRAAVVSAVVLGLAWIQPAWEQLFGRGEGNLQRLATHAGEPGPP